MRLSEAPVNVELRVREIMTGKEAKKKLITIGIRTDELLLKLSGAKWGPILVKPLSYSSSKIAIGRGIANKIEVSYEN
jgi:Fe2+ transport system protein FeoA